MLRKQDLLTKKRIKSSIIQTCFQSRENSALLHRNFQTPNFQKKLIRNFPSATAKDLFYLSPKKSKPNLILNIKSSVPRKNKLIYKFLEYKPKRLTNYSKKNTNNIFSLIKDNIESKSIYNSLIKNITNKSLPYNLSSSLILDKTDEKNTNQKKIIKNRTDQILKFSRLSETLKNLGVHPPKMMENQKIILNSNFDKLSKLILAQRNLLFNDNKTLNKFITSNEFFTNKTLFEEETIFDYLEKTNIYNNLIIKNFEILYNEINNLSDKINELLEKNKHQRSYITTLKNNFNNINNNDNNNKKDYTTPPKKENFKEKENLYLLSIYQLNNEVKDLVKLLDKNKEYYDKYKNMEKKEKETSIEKENLKSHFFNELRKQGRLIIGAEEANDELNNHINELKKIIEDIKIENQQQKLKIRQDELYIQKLKKEVGAKEIKNKMISEELNSCMKKYEKLVKKRKQEKEMGVQNEDEDDLSLDNI